MKTLVSVSDLNREDILKILDYANAFETKKREPYGFAKGKILGLVFLQESLRTSASLKSAMLRLGGSWIDFDLSYVKSGDEGLEDSVVAVAPLVDVLGVRGPADIDIRSISKKIKTPIMNGMIGMEHSIGALWYAYTLQQRLGKLEGLKIGMVGMTKYSRPSYAIYRCLSKLGAHFYEDSVIPDVGAPKELVDEITKNGGKYERAKFNGFIGEVDYLFIAEGLPIKGADKNAVEKFNKAYTPFNQNMLGKLRNNAVFAYCMPRSLTDGRLSAEKEVDSDKRNISVEMMEKSVFVNMGILAWFFE
ncbi:MAG TPA: hypothetical protein VJH24_00165 [Candidatus Bilamarchaeaceae archaeon]|nr:hypothetical protein [Candidatus Bilamarchaeaceae archaeon]